MSVVFEGGAAVTNFRSIVEIVAANMGISLGEMVQNAVPMKYKRRVIRRRGKKFVIRPVIGWAMVRWNGEKP